MNTLLFSREAIFKDAFFQKAAHPDRSYLWLIILLVLSLLFLLCGPFLRLLDPAAAAVDIGILSLLLFGLLATVTICICCLWLQELLWQPFKRIRTQLGVHFNQLSSWQQLLLYFGAFFLGLYAWVWVFSILI